ncbi:AtuA-related protein [Paracoccus tibetensis]|uniref:AtuA-like ferredoxin-fold domain-containing protein n=1 Tax=Paracoccus tibetensis TaxID=336292 RepID=A0A1G5JYE7_9RHOB|nr:hypothetical protein [Paracoccus tibetensis]SCY93423.1 hypothetical protein SAMN05660710_03551 [Paracoccus tibetensis]
MTTMPLHRLAHARTGDKGNRLSVSLIAHDPADWGLLTREVTEARVLALFAHRGASAVRHYLVPQLHAMNFVIEDALEGGSNTALCLGAHGKTLSYLLLGMEIDPDAGKYQPL